MSDAEPAGSSIVYRRIAAGDDIDATTEMLHEAYAPLAEAGQRFLASHQNSAKTRNRMDRGETFLAIDGDLVVGVVTLADTATTDGSPFYDRPDVAAFGQFAVRPAYQLRGIGSHLMDIIEERAREKGVAELALDTSEHAAELIATYERRGYRFVEYVRWGSVNYRSKIMSKRL